MRSLMVAAIFLAGAFAGCAQTDAPVETTSATPTTPALPPNVVIIGSGNPQFAGEIPEFVQSFALDLPSAEPTLGFTRQGLYMTAIGPSGVNLGNTAIVKTTDNGTTWTDVTPSLPNGMPVFPTTLDPYVWVDPVTDTIYMPDLYVACSFLQWSTDEGATWLANPAACGLPVNDHQTLFSGPAKPLPIGTPVGENRVLYYCWNAVAFGACSRSVDGGITWTSGAPTYREPVQTGSGIGGPGVCGSLHGHGRASEVTGTVFVGKGHCGVPFMSRSTDNGLTWNAAAINVTTGASGHDVNVAIDDAGTVYAFWLDARLYPRLSVSRDDGVSWGPALNVSAPGINRNTFPSIVAGSAGRVAFNYWGASAIGGFEANETNRLNLTWNSYIGVSINADSDSPVFVTTTANDPADPVARGDCLTEGRCLGAFDFMDIAAHPVTGQIAVAMVDLCHQQCIEGVRSADEGINRAAAGIQVGGTRLREPAAA